VKHLLQKEIFMKRSLLIQVLLLTQIIVYAQKDCRSAEYRQEAINKSPQLIAKIAEIEAFTQNLQKRKTVITNGESPATISTPQVINIPVVVHIVYNSSAQNITDAQVQSQIDVLNKDYARQNADTNNTPLVFRPVAANCGFHFELAKVDTLGYATSGIVRKRTSILAFNIDDRIKSSAMGGDDAWNKDQYLNIWVGNLTGGILGYSSVVGGAKEDDGVVILYNAFGVGGSAASPFDKGRTATHEIGHWLNLIHTWGDADCGDDHVDDTPPQQTADRGCPNGILISCNNAPNGDMYTNYMDFTNDNCMNLFTNGQRDRMLALFAPGGERYAMLSSTALTATPLTGTVSTTTTEPINQQITVYPNPATSMVSVQFTDDAIIGSNLEVYNQVGQKVITAQVNELLMQVNVSSLGKGMYYIKIGDGKTKSITKLIKM
jgi:pregnancy-associated plasma protein-A/type IX secretion system substrate protein